MVDPMIAPIIGKRSRFRSVCRPIYQYLFLTLIRSYILVDTVSSLCLSLISDFSLAIAFPLYCFATLPQLLGVTVKSISCLDFSNFIFFKCVAVIKSSVWFCDR